MKQLSRQVIIFQSIFILIAFAIQFLFQSLETEIPFHYFVFSVKDIFIGVAGAIVIAAIAMQFDIDAQRLIDLLGPFLIRMHWSVILLLSLFIGYSEELLFRGSVEPFWSAFYSPLWAAVVTNVCFAILHWISIKYVLAVFIVGMLHSLVARWPGEYNLLRPVTMHSIYDFIAFLVLKRAFLKQQAVLESQPSTGRTEDLQARTEEDLE